jgi:hypothetical protein
MLHRASLSRELRTRAGTDAARDLGCYRYHTLLASSWYPIEHYCEVFRAFRAVRSDGPELARAIGKLAARHDMSGVHKQILARLISPQALLSMSQRVFSTYYDTGKFDLLESRKGFVHCMFRDCLGFDESMWAEVAGSCESLLEIAGAENVRIRPIAGAGSGDSSAEFEARWT